MLVKNQEKVRARCKSELEKEFWTLMERLTGPSKKPIASTCFKRTLIKRWQQFAKGRQHEAHDLQIRKLEQVVDIHPHVTSEITAESSCRTCGYETRKS